jgi:CHAT domain-containing protein/tetratricopeptide (TPR) repeat protein
MQAIPGGRPNQSFFSTLLGEIRRARGDLDGAEPPLLRALAWSNELPSRSMASARVSQALGNVLVNRQGKVEEARRLVVESRHIYDALAPGSRELARTLRWLGSLDIELPEGEALVREAVQIVEGLAPDSADMAEAWLSLGYAFHMRSEKAAAELYSRRALAIFEAEAPGSRPHADVLDNIGLILADRGDLEGAERALQRSNELFERAMPGRVPSYILSHRSWVAGERRDWRTAERLRRRALELVASDDPMLEGASARHDLSGLALSLLQQRRIDEAVRTSLRALKGAPPEALLQYMLEIHGRVLEEAGDLNGAEQAYCEAADAARKRLPGSLFLSLIILRLGEVALKKEDLVAAEHHFLQSRSRLSIAMPDTSYEAQALYGLGRIRRRQGQLLDAAEFLRRAIEAVEAQSARVGGSEETRAGFKATFRDYYRDYAETLIEMGRNSDAFVSTERYRARGFLSMVAERDLTFSEDLPADLVRDWKKTDADYAQVQAELSRSKFGADSAELHALGDRVRDAAEKKDEVKRRIREASPRVAALRYPAPFSVQEASNSLDTDTALLSYMVGVEQTLLFVVRPSVKQPLSVLRLSVGEVDLRKRTADLGRLIREEAPEAQVAGLSYRLYQDLIAPAIPLLARSKRLLILADGPLHRLPFAALVSRIQDGRPEYLVERFALHSVLSATVYGEILKARTAAAREKALVAFGDPSYPRMDDERADKLSLNNLRSAVRTANGLSPLPFTRTEVDAIAKLYPEDSEVFIGEAATEERAKETARNRRYLHFACHGVLDENFPINSGLVLSVPPDPKEGQDDGVLQAWEIIEKVRLDADLVTLSACETGLGKEEGGEGLVGLTRAFQYAGARSVLASLWAVSDESTADLMSRFYGHLKAGEAKVDALRAAQLEMIGGARQTGSNQTREMGGIAARSASNTAHPFRWAAFQLVGDGH